MSEAQPSAQIEWEHPRLGRIREVACPEHEQEVIRALRTLGIGNFGTPAEDGEACLRCGAVGQPRAFLAVAVIA